MDQQWQPYSDMARNRQARYPTTQQQPQQSNGSAQQHQQQSSYGYEAYQSASVASQPQSMVVSPVGTPHTRSYASGDGDVAMEDADPYNRMKYPARPSHQHRPSGQYLGQEDSSAARRYSPMTAAPSSPYAPSSQQPSQTPYGHYPSQSTSARQSPTRSSHYSTPSQSSYTTPSKSDDFHMHGLRSFYMITDNVSAATSRQPPLHLHPIQPGDSSYDQYYPNSATAQLNAVFGREAKSPRKTRPLHTTGTANMPRGPVPKFKMLDATHDLQPRINPQPAYRRANPEGGFISVCPLSKLTGQQH